MSDNVVRLNLDAKRAEVDGDIKKVVEIGGIEYDLPAKLPLYFAEHLVNGRVSLAVRLLFGDEHEPVVGPQLELDETGGDLNTIAKELYGFSVGEAAPSSTPSNRAGRRSRATSNASTAST